jgi:hypothetical protein
MTAFGDMVTQFGGAPIGIPYSYLQGPRGKTLFVAPYRTASATANSANQSSDSNPGTFDAPLKTIAAAYAKCSGNLGEVIYVLGYSNSAADVTEDWSATQTWSKSFVHLIGLSPPIAFSQRTRVNQLSTATGVSPLLDVTGHGNVFANMQFFQGVADATSLINVRVTGQRNLFENVHFAGVGDATMSAAGAASLAIVGGAENVFRGCTIGVDTAIADADATCLLLQTSATRNRFEDCLFDAYISAAGFAHVTVGTNGVDRATYFKNCLFTSKSTNKAITQTSVFSIPVISQGAIILQNSKCFSDGGAVDWDSNNRGILWNDSVAAAASGAGGILTVQ